MKIELTEGEKQALDRQHKTERDKRVVDRIKAVLLNAEGWKQAQIAQALRIRIETVQDHLDDYRELHKLKPGNKGTTGQLSSEQTQALICHLESVTYLKVQDICVYVEKTFGIKYSVSGMTKWLKAHDFSYKKPKTIPAKADVEKQAAFIAFYSDLLKTTPEDEPIEFGDGVHPTMATKVTYGWIKKGKKNDKLIATIASRTRMNLFGSLNLETMGVIIGSYETVDSQALKEHFKKLKEKYPKAIKIHLILDRGSYNTSQETKEAAKELNIILHYLPPYSPNLNPIERLWKIMNENVRNNRVFESAHEFREAILNFFTKTWAQISHSMLDRINDNFQILKQAF